MAADKRARLETDDEGGRLDGRSSLRAAVVAVLLERPGHGYDIAQRINLRAGSSVRIEPKHIYSVLGSLEKAGLVRSRMERDTEPHGKTIFHPTEWAERAWREWRAAPPEVSEVRKDIQTRLAFSSKADVPELLRGLSRYRIDLLDAIETNATEHAPGRSWGGLVKGLMATAVIRHLQSELKWIEEVCDELEAVVPEQSP
jgi:DNA-binding PadR family transcriptional regulator